MRIKKMLEIKNFGVFSNFSWLSTCQDFKQYNFFYGWNYSGKTTLSRFFKSLEDKKIHPDFPELSFKLQTDNGNLTEKDVGRDFNIRVFNEEFVSENFRWNDDDFEINPVLMLGKESIEFENSINKLKKEKEKLKKEKEKIEVKKKEKEKELNTKLANEASKVRDVFGITNAKEFDKKVLEARINELKDIYKNQILKNDRYYSLLNIIKNSTEYEIIPEINIQLKLNDYKIEAKNILGMQVKPQQIIEDLKNDPELSNWVKEGIKLHQNRTVCLFCGNKLPDDLFDRLNKHFSKRI